MKIFILFISLLSLAYSADAQGRFGRAKINGSKVDAISKDFSSDAASVEAAFVQMMKDKGYSSRNYKGYLFFDDVTMPDISTGSRQFYFKSERKNSKTSTATLLIAKGDKNFLSVLNESDEMRKGETMLDALTPSIETFQSNADILAQEEVVKTENGKISKLKNEADDLDRKMKRLQQDIEKQQSVIDKEQGKLEDLKKKG